MNVPGRSLRLRDAIAIIIGIVVGAGIFRTPAVVAANASSETVVLLAWVLGGLLSLIGALCYAELATAYPNAGGEYHFLMRAYGRRVSFLFAWARLSVIQTGSIALLAYVFGDYASEVLRLGAYSSALYATIAIVLLTGLHYMGVRHGTGLQNVLTSVEILGLAAVIVAAASMIPAPTAAAPTQPSGLTLSSFGLMMVFVLLTYGGWNEGAYVSAELRDPQRNMSRALLWSLLAITALYVLANVAYLRALGLSGVAGSNAVAADVMRRLLGSAGATAISVLVAVAALTSASATIFTGARTSYAWGRDFRALSLLGRWSERGGTPTSGLLVQGAVAIVLVLLGAFTRKGFETMVSYTAPVFWLFFLLAGIALFVLRRRDPKTPRPFRVPLYPLTPLLFCSMCAYLLYSSLAYTGIGAFVGVAVLATGALLMFMIEPRRRAETTDPRREVGHAW